MMKEIKMSNYTRIENENVSEVAFNFYTDLNVLNKLIFVNTVVDAIVTKEHYNTVVLDTVIDYVIIKVFTDVDTSEVDVMSGNDLAFISAMEDFIEKTNIVDIVKSNMKDGLFDELIIAIERDIEYKTGIRMSTVES